MATNLNLLPQSSLQLFNFFGVLFSALGLRLLLSGRLLTQGIVQFPLDLLLGHERAHKLLFHLVELKHLLAELLTRGFELGSQRFGDELV
jgi:hypothetical protein